MCAVRVKGCNCKRSGCSKKYCECFESKKLCTSYCKCIGCRNNDGSRDTENIPIPRKVPKRASSGTKTTAGRQKRSREAPTESVWNEEVISVAINAIAKSDVAASSGGTSTKIFTETDNNVNPPAPENEQCQFLTEEVIDAAIQCMVSQASECEKGGLPSYLTEKVVVEELGRCLSEMFEIDTLTIENNNENK